MIKGSKVNRKMKSTKNTKMILIFLGVSFLFWILIKLSKPYIDTVPINVEYFNLPKDKMLQEEPIKSIDVTLKTFGFDLIKYHFFKRKVTIDLQAIKRKENNVYFQLSQNLLSQLSTQLISDVEVLAIKPDTLFYIVGMSTTKHVKIVPDIEIKYQSGYNLFGNLKIEPNEVLISGPEILIDSILQVVSQKKIVTDVNSSFKINIPLLTLDESSKVNYEVQEVTVSGVVEKFTEAKFTLPFNIENLPDGYEINTFPNKVEIVFQVGLSDYNKIDINDFKISCDYQRSEKDGLNYLIPKVVLKPSFVSEIKIIPNQIEYLIKE
ncbi:MAG TPA: hypothetical protein DDZ39_09580 [Flavobacteriaceae bacterium]|nr:hypothetical protein [Flavobacteriaceae bacterium]HBS11157.1 hypothetical protein [Flavobacteriaceae bacterium]